MQSIEPEPKLGLSWAFSNAYHGIIKYTIIGAINVNRIQRRDSRFENAECALC